MKFSPKVAVVTGAASGIGFATTQELGRQGAKIVISDFDETKGKEVVASLMKENIESLFIKADVTNEKDVQHHR